MAALRLLLFGAPRFEVDGEMVDGVRRKAVAMAAYLALTDRPQTRDMLATLFWPDQDEERGRTSLRSSLHNLTSLSTETWLEADRQMVSLNTEAIEIDVREFVNALAGTRVHLHSDGKLCEDCEAALNRAVDLYREDFLTGFSLPDSAEFDTWQATQREWLNRECSIALRRLTVHAAKGGLKEAIAYARRWLAINMLDEQAHRLLMRLYVANGQRAEALRQYQDCVRLLDEELATPPEDETTKLYESIRRGDSLAAGVEGGLSAIDGARGGDLFGATSVLPPMPTLVVGRERVLREIKARLGLPKAEERRPVTVIEGWPGVGKSTTIGALAHDPDLKTAYPDGVLWTSLGEAPNLIAELTVWGEALRLIAPGKVPKLEDLTSQITSALANRRMLLIVDDVWQVEHAAPFRAAGQGSAMIMTSRLNMVARALAPTSEDVYRLPVLSDEYALNLLTRLAPEAVREHPDEALELVRDLEGLPLAIQVAGRLLHEEMRMGWGICDLLSELREGKSLLAAQAPGDMREASGQSQPTITSLLRRSTDALDEETLVRFALLGLFVPKPATFDLRAMAAAWGIVDPKPTARMLVNRGLIEPISGGRFQMHALLVLHAKALLEGA
ncbi:MAG: hypothetical protein JNL42_10180 [Anaerolineae bacterium]|nr:hypothetical protein [Anaerolineae bacterium]